MHNCEFEFDEMQNNNIFDNFMEILYFIIIFFGVPLNLLVLVVYNLDFQMKNVSVKRYKRAEIENTSFFCGLF